MDTWYSCMLISLVCQPPVWRVRVLEFVLNAEVRRLRLAQGAGVWPSCRPGGLYRFSCVTLFLPLSTRALPLSAPPPAFPCVGCGSAQVGWPHAPFPLCGVWQCTGLVRGGQVVGEGMLVRGGLVDGGRWGRAGGGRGGGPWVDILAGLRRGRGPSQGGWYGFSGSGFTGQSGERQEMGELFTG